MIVLNGIYYLGIDESSEYLSVSKMVVSLAIIKRLGKTIIFNGEVMINIDELWKIKKY